MPVHDWTRMMGGDFHHFHQRWIQAITDALNRDLLPPEYMALSEQVTARPIPDVVTLQTRRPAKPSGGAAVASKLPSARLVAKLERINYAKRADRIVIRHGRGRIVSVIEIVSPGNKDSRNALRSFVEKSADFLNQGIHLMVIDLFPPMPSDPAGIQNVIIEEFGGTPFELPPTQPLTAGSYVAYDAPTAYVETLGVGEALPSLPLFLEDEWDYIPAPLESSYNEAFAALPRQLKAELEAA
ncbi:MAG: DUF4058 family protein [Planctomycetia bacterium]|nr:DUF4058 family protein [Planctomycetia bacterium]